MRDVSQHRGGLRAFTVRSWQSRGLAIAAVQQ